MFLMLIQIFKQGSSHRLPQRQPRWTMLALSLLCYLATGTLEVTPVYAARRPGPPRPLRLLWPDPPTSNAALNPPADAFSTQDGVFAAHSVVDTKARNGGSHHDSPTSWTLFFTRQDGGTRNIWRADPQIMSGGGATTNQPGEAEDRAAMLRGLAWRVAPVTHLTAPLFAEQADVTPDGRSLICVTNALGGPAMLAGAPTGGNGNAAPQRSQIARLDLQSGEWTTLTSNDAHDHSPTIAPDGRRLAFVSNRSGLESVYVMPLNGGPPKRMATMAQNPCWLNNNTLLFESTRPGQSGLYTFTLALESDSNSREVRPQRFFNRLGEAAVSPEGSQICVAAAPIPGLTRSNSSADPVTGRASSTSRQLYLLAPDGSGARAIPGTEGAHSPHYTPDGNAIIFDAPLDNPATNAAAPAAQSRTLWLMPMLHEPPAALLMDVRPIVRFSAPTAPPEEVEIIGTAFAESQNAPEIKLEYGEGTEPTQWHNIGVRRGTVQQGKLGTWHLPPRVHGNWTLRLTVTDASNEQAQTTFPVHLPLRAPSRMVLGGPPVDNVVDNGSSPESSGSSPTTITVAPQLAQTPPATIGSVPPPNPQTLPPTPSPVRTGQHAAVRPHNSKAKGTPPQSTPKPLPRLAGPVKVLPLPALPPAPTPTPTNKGTAPTGTQPDTGTDNPPTNSLPTFPQDAASPPPPIWGPPAGPLPPKTKRPKRTRTTKQTRRQTTQRPRPQPKYRDRDNETDTSPPAASATYDSGGADAARITVEGTPAVMQAGQNVTVMATLRNMGTRDWATESTQPVRLVYRWVDASTGTRTRWAVRWLQSTVRPGNSTQLSVTLTAPPRPGRYRLSYIMIRLNGDKFEPPPATTPTQRWPGEFGGITYSVTVTGGERQNNDERQFTGNEPQRRRDR